MHVVINYEPHDANLDCYTNMQYNQLDYVVDLMFQKSNSIRTYEPCLLLDITLLRY